MVRWSIAARRCALTGLVVLTAALSFHFSAPSQELKPRGERPKQSDKLSNILLHTQHGKPVRFYDDLVRDRTVLINLMFTGCGDVCPASSAALASLHDLLGERVGRDIVMLSISIDPFGDTPERLKRYWEAFGSKPGWLFLTGKPDEVERLRRELGMYDLDPAIDADPAQHSGMLTVGNDRTDRWLALPVLMHAKQLATTILRVSAPTSVSADAGRGQEVYRTYCSACHGARGGADGPLSKLLVPPPPRHSDAAHMEALSDDYLYRLLKEGGPAVGKSPLMNAWGKVLSEDQLRDLIAYMRTLAVTGSVPVSGL